MLNKATNLKVQGDLFIRFNSAAAEAVRALHILIEECGSTLIDLDTDKAHNLNLNTEKLIDLQHNAVQTTRNLILDEATRIRRRYDMYVCLTFDDSYDWQSDVGAWSEKAYNIKDQEVATLSGTESGSATLSHSILKLQRKLRKKMTSRSRSLARHTETMPKRLREIKLFHQAVILNGIDQACATANNLILVSYNLESVRAARQEFLAWASLLTAGKVQDHFLSAPQTPYSQLLARHVEP